MGRLRNGIRVILGLGERIDERPGIQNRGDLAQIIESTGVGPRAGVLIKHSRQLVHRRVQPISVSIAAE